MTKGPRLEVIDLSPRFLHFYEKALAENADPDRRWELWREHYGFAAVPPTPEGQAIARALLDQAWDRYAAILDLVWAGESGLAPRPEPVLAQVARRLRCSQGVVRLVAFVGGFEGNAFSMRREGIPTVCIPLEQDPTERALVLPHELAHGVHMLTADLPGRWERPLGQLIFEEGLATRLTEALLPEFPPEDHVEYAAHCGTPRWLQLCRERHEAILRGVLASVEDSSAATVARFTYGPGPAGLEREAYYAGWVVFGRLLEEGRSVEQLAHVPAPELVPVVRETITMLLHV